MNGPKPMFVRYDVNGERFTELADAEWAARRWAGVTHGDVYWVDGSTIEDRDNRIQVLVLVAVDPSPSE